MLGNSAEHSGDHFVGRGTGQAFFLRRHLKLRFVEYDCDGGVDYRVQADSIYDEASTMVAFFIYLTLQMCVEI